MTTIRFYCHKIKFVSEMIRRKNTVKRYCLLYTEIYRIYFASLQYLQQLRSDSQQDNGFS